jgi:Acetyl-CoA dehydrogenase C-terminal like
VLAWVWLDVALCVHHATDEARLNKGFLDEAFIQGKLSACDYFFSYELPKIAAWLNVVSNKDMTCAHMQADWF